MTIFEVEGGASCNITLFDLEVRDTELEELDVFGEPLVIFGGCVTRTVSAVG